jgi:hypothetical protein
LWRNGTEHATDETSLVVEEEGEGGGALTGFDFFTTVDEDEFPV